MRSLTIEARSLESAQALYSALSSFVPELIGEDGSGYRVTVSLGGSDRQVIEILDAIERHVTERDSGPARVQLEGRQYTLHPKVTARASWLSGRPHY